jgi:polyisoprenoid-binding protein YceI
MNEEGFMTRDTVSVRVTVALSFGIAAIFSGVIFGAPTTWEIDAMHSAARFSVKHMMVTNVTGEFGGMKGAFVIDDKDMKKTTVEATLDATTITTHNDKRDEHLKSADFFDVTKFPTLTFKSTKFSPEKKGEYAMTGDLTMHGVTKPVTLTVTELTKPVKGMQGMARGVSATGKINRKDWKLTWNKTLDAGGLAVGDEVTLNVDLELHEAKAAGDKKAEEKDTAKKTNG